MSKPPNKQSIDCKDNLQKVGLSVSLVKSCTEIGAVQAKHIESYSIYSLNIHILGGKL